MSRAIEGVIEETLVPVGAPFVVTEHGMSINGKAPEYDDFLNASIKLKQVHGALQYWLGDFVNLTEQVLGEMSAQILDKDFLDEKVLRECRYVAGKVAPKVRALSPSWAHSKAVADLPEGGQEKWIQKALDEDWIASKLASEVAAAGVGGKTGMRFLLIVDAGTEAKQAALAKKLEGDGYGVTMRTGVKKAAKAKKVKKLRAAKAAKRTGSVRQYAKRKAKKK